jgi:surface antigen
MIVGFIFSLVVTSCTRHLTDNLIAGDYYVSGDWGKSTLVLRTNGTFIQRVLLKDGNEKSIEGKWRMLDSNVHAYTRAILFEPFLNMWADHLGALTPNASYTVEAIGFRGVWIDVDSVAGTTYKKQ